MAFYRHLGPITFLFQSSQFQVFTTQRYFLIQSKNIGESLQVLATQMKRIAQKYNNLLKQEILQVYSEVCKPSCLFIQRRFGNFVHFSQLQRNSSIQTICHVLKILIDSFICLNVKQTESQIQKCMIFQLNNMQSGVYITIPQINKSTVGKATKTTDRILRFVQNNYITHTNTSSKLLLSKLSKCVQLQQMQQQLDYFKKVYQIGNQKIKQRVTKANQIGAINQSSKGNHRLYRKRSQQLHQEKQRKHYPICLRSFIRKPTMQQNFAEQCLGTKNSYQSLHCRKGNSKINLFSNRKSGSKTLNFGHSISGRSSSRGHQYQKFLKIGKNGLLSNNKSRSKNKIGTSSLRKLEINKYTDNYVNSCSSSFNSTNNSQIQKKQNRLNKGKAVCQQSYGQRCSKQLINDSLKMWCQKRQTNSTYHNQMNTKKMAQSISNKTKLTRLNSNQIKFINENIKNFLNTNNNGIQCQAQNVLMGNNMQQKQIQSTLNYMNDKQKQIKFINENSGNQKLYKNPDVQQTVRHNTRKIKTGVKTQTPRMKSIQNQNITQNKNDMQDVQLKVVEKQRTIRKKSLNTIEIVENNLIKSVKMQLETINVVGQCVTNISKYCQKLKASNQDKILWQLPAFVLYKQFYIKRLEIEQKMKGQTQKLNSQKGQFHKIIKQISEQNKMTLQSLSKLLKTVYKKLKKYKMDGSAIDQCKSMLNMDMSCKWQSSHDNLISCFLTQLEEMFEKNQDSIKLQIAVIDAFTIIKGGQYHHQEKNINQQTNQSSLKTYYRNRVNQLNKLLNKT